MQQLYWVSPLLTYTDAKSVSLSKISISLLNAYYEPIIWLSTIKKERKQTNLNTFTLVLIVEPIPKVREVQPKKGKGAS